MASEHKRTCPICATETADETLNACPTCGAPLAAPLEENTTTHRVEEKTELPQHIETLLIDLVPSAGGVAIYFTGDIEPFTIRQEDEFILGRVVEGMSVGENETIVDLTPYNAFEMGISRRHSMIRRTKTGYEICDLGSTNGTWVNGLRLVPYKTYPFNKAQVRIGLMRLFIIYREFNK
jgi:hypothetical protein